MSAEKFTVHDDMFGAYVKIPTGASRDMHIYKVIGRIESNGYSDVPIMASAKSVLHEEIVPVLNVVHCGVSEDTVIRVALSDCEIFQMHDALLTAEDLVGMDGRPVWWEDKYGHAGYGIVSVTEFGRVIYIVSAIKEVFCAVVDGEMNDRLGLKIRRPYEPAPFNNENLVSGLPCKIGDTVWAIRNFKGHREPQQGVVSEMSYMKNMELHIVVKYVARGAWGKTVFATLQEAEAAIKKETKHGRVH